MSDVVAGGESDYNRDYKLFIIVLKTRYLVKVRCRISTKRHACVSVDTKQIIEAIGRYIELKDEVKQLRKRRKTTRIHRSEPERRKIAERQNWKCASEKRPIWNAWKEWGQHNRDYKPFIIVLKARIIS